MKPSPRLLPFLLLALLSLTLLAPIAAAKKAAPDAAPSLNFLTEKSLDPIQLLPDPVKADSPEFKFEIEALLRLQESRTPEEVARAKSEKKYDVFAFQSVLGEWFTPANLPLTESLFKKIDKDSKYFSTKAKDYFNRPRPKDSDKRITPLMDDSDPSYPSGHATRGVMLAEILANIFPEKRPALLARGQQIGYDRLLAGVHMPSDVAAGRVLGHALAHALLADPNFQSELAKVKEELIHAAAATPQPVPAAK